AGVVALAAAVAELAEIAVDRELRLLALFRAGDDVEDGMLAGQLLEHALGDVEGDGRAGRTGADAREAAGIVAGHFGLGIRRSAERGRIGRREDQYPVALRVGLAGLGRRLLLARRE